MAERVPERAIEHIPAAIAHAEASLEPCGQKGAAVLLLELWSIFPMPANETADRIWNETLSQYPADLVKSAISQLIATRTWERDAPVPGQVVALLRDEHSSRNSYLRKLQSMQKRATLDAKGT